jgi:gluconate 5-dehydrogenase
MGKGPVSEQESRPPTAAELFDLGGQVALVTGASRGLGWAAARVIAAAGAHVLLNGRDAGTLEARCQQLAGWGLSARALPFDTGDADAAAAAVAGIVERHGRLDILYSNTAASVRKPFLELSEAEWQAVVDQSLTAGWRLARLAAPVMALRGYGRIVFVSSINAVVARPSISAYTAAKAALNGLVRGLCADLAQYGITVNALAPGYFLTDGNAALRRATPDFEQRIASRTPAGRWGDPAGDIGAAALYLVSPAAAYANGTVLTVDGGLTAVL